ncbi:heavy metal translocating P-type ATPase [Nibricoccus aquaticus]|uniref:Heavy metal translocating P-type ATPase n=1 Tax=Nibricoccus aquaticus TaxID=2576891 RepID=A0A290Q658_9BACT|nr:cation-translocating P-type ATPase [Nibricoccus aquaticus]ATC62670.1 heavy metal translocating P-type ATPase [Nibricoccus aquaticus]
MSTKQVTSENWAETLARFLREEPGVEAVRIDPAARKVSVATLGDVDLKQLEARLAETLAAVESQLGRTAKIPVGYTLKREGETTEFAEVSCATAPSFWKWREFAWPELDEPEKIEESEWKELGLLAAACGVFGALGFVTEKFSVGPEWLSRVLYGVALIAGGWDAAKDTWENLRERKVDIHFLMLAVAVGAMCIGAWGEAVLLLFLFSASGAMEDYALDRTQREVGSLLKSAPKTATLVLPNGSERLVKVEELGIGDRVRVKPGEAFPADGTVSKGRSASDESALTGEAVPVEKDVGAPVFSGTINLWGAVDFDVRRLPSESTLQKIIRLIQTAQKLRAPSERFTDKFGGGYTLTVLGVCAAMFLVWWLAMGLPAFTNAGETTSAFYRAMTLLVVMSPCALVLSIPSAILAAIAWGAKHGVLFRGGAAIEKLAAIDLVALDKTGTLTTGELAVTGVESFPAGREKEVLELAFALEVNSQHPLARAIVRHARAQGVREVDADKFESITGHGVRGQVGGAQVLLGRRELLESGPLAEWAKTMPASSPELSEVWVVGRDVVGRVLLKDQIRAESREVLAKLKRAGIRTVMLTGDRRQAAENVAKEIGLDEVRAGLTPEGKVEAIQALKKEGHTVAMVGDGVNDAPCLAAADVSVAMGARGSDAALEQAEVILMHDRIENFLAALRLSQRAKRVIRQNLAISLGVVVLMAVASVIGVVPLAVGVAAHEGSTVVVCLNSLRLLFGRNR